MPSGLTASQLLTSVARKRDTVRALKSVISRTKGRLRLEAEELAELEDECRQRGIQVIVVPAAEPPKA